MSFPSRRWFRKETLASSPSFLTSLTSCCRRSVVSGGIGMRMMVPSELGVSPREDC